MEIIVRVACTLYIEIFPMIFSRKKKQVYTHPVSILQYELRFTRLY